MTRCAARGVPSPTANARALSHRHPLSSHPPVGRSYLDINLALNALEAAFIQLTGKAEAKGAFFPRMRERLTARGHKTADYDVCLRD